MRSRKCKVGSVISKTKVDNCTLTNVKDILNAQSSFFKKLYEKRETQQSSFNFFNTNMNTLNEIDKVKCEGILSEYECYISLKGMQNNKSPGSDGITTEFYKIFWNDIKKYLINSLNYSCQKGELTELQKQGVITLLPKSGKDINNLNNWRPISLLNVDYKIATKAIANRIKPTLNTIISQAQTGFIKDRYIGENIRLLHEVLEYIDEHDLPSLLFFSDFEKAFDSLDHEFMFRCLRHFNFGDSILSWVKLFYSNSTSCTINNGHFSDFFPTKRGVRQGCPLSPYLFIICIELLSYEITQNDNIKGITYKNKEIKNSLFADDATFVTDGSEHSFKTLISVVDNFSFISGLKLNTSKCTVLRAGLLKLSNIIFCEKKKLLLEF